MCEFLQDLYDQLNSTLVQGNYRTIRSLPVGVVYIQHLGEGWDEMRAHLVLMKQLGYNCLKGIRLLPSFDLMR